jgi:two-component system sensor histidine kinase YesM
MILTMKGFKVFSYLSVRAAVLFVAAGVVAFLPWPISAAGIVLIIPAGWIWIVVPYVRMERVMGLFMEGYTLSPEESAQMVAMSPATKRLFEQFREVLSPSQLFDMNKRQAQYLALQNQINPHFLYNTLESIRSEAIQSGLDSVADMTQSLATFFRYTITKVENLVSVEEELQNCETYFNIQQYRFGNRLQLSIEYAQEDWDDIIRCRIPKLTMQPILENSIIHGTELKVGIGHLKIHLAKTNKRLLIRISDDGLGMDEGRLISINNNLGKSGLNITSAEQEVKGGFALVNVNNRIRLLFGDEYGLHVFSIPGVGTDVEISLPAISSDREIVNKEILQQ